MNVRNMDIVIRHVKIIGNKIIKEFFLIFNLDPDLCVLVLVHATSLKCIMDLII